MKEVLRYDGDTANNYIDRVEFVRSLKDNMSAFDIIYALMTFTPAKVKPVEIGQEDS